MRGCLQIARAVLWFDTQDSEKRRNRGRPHPLRCGVGGFFDTLAEFLRNNPLIGIGGNPGHSDRYEAFSGKRPKNAVL